MSYSLFRDIIAVTEEFEDIFPEKERTLANFAGWLFQKTSQSSAFFEDQEVVWEGKEKGRSAESVINTSLVHLFRYAKIYSKLAVQGSPFSSIDEIIFLLNLLHLGSMTKIRLIALNIHEKSTGIQIINRLLEKGFVREEVNQKDKRSKKIAITQSGKLALDQNMEKVREASNIVAGNLSAHEKLQLIRLLQKLEIFHAEKMKAGELGIASPEV